MASSNPADGTSSARLGSKRHLDREGSTDDERRKKLAKEVLPSPDDDSNKDCNEDQDNSPRTGGTQQWKKYICYICGKQFSVNRILRRHIKNVHETVASFQCPKCPKAFKTDLRLQQHTKRMHQSTEAPSDDATKVSALHSSDLASTTPGLIYSAPSPSPEVIVGSLQNSLYNAQPASSILMGHPQIPFRPAPQPGVNVLVGPSQNSLYSPASHLRSNILIGPTQNPLHSVPRPDLTLPVSTPVLIPSVTPPRSLNFPMHGYVIPQQFYPGQPLPPSSLVYPHLTAYSPTIPGSTYPLELAQFQIAMQTETQVSPTGNAQNPSMPPSSR